MENTSYADQTNPQQPMPRTWLVESILVTILCCLPLGIVAIVYASQVETRYRQGDYEASRIASDNAGRWTKIALIAGVSVGLLYALFAMFFGGLALWNMR